MRLLVLLASLALVSLDAPLVAQSTARDARFGCEAERIQSGFATNDHLGHTLAAGDWNGDGLDDLLAGGLTSTVTGKQSGRGKAWLFTGNAKNVSEAPALRFVDVPEIADFPATLAFLGDLDGDGGADIAIGTPGSSQAELGANAGAVWIFLSDTSTGAATRTISLSDRSAADLVLELPPGAVPPGSEAFFGFSVDAVGDLDGDGRPEIVVGAPGTVYEAKSSRIAKAKSADDTGGRDGSAAPPGVAGRAFVFSLGEPADGARLGAFTLTAELVAGPEATQRGNRFGWAVAGLGDVDGDGFDDLAVSAPWSGSSRPLSFESTRAGVVYFFRGAADGELSATPILPRPGGRRARSAKHKPRMFGHTLAGHTDLDGDGRPELLVGCPSYAIDGKELGAVYAYRVDDTGALVDAFAALQPLMPPVEISQQHGGEPEPAGRFGWDLVGLPSFDARSPGRGAFLAGALMSNNDAPTTSPCEEPQGGRISGRAYVISVQRSDSGAPRLVVDALYKGEAGPEGGRMRLGTSIAAGDFDGDGLLDAAAAGSGYSSSRTLSENGRLYLFSNPTKRR